MVRVYQNLSTSLNCLAGADNASPFRWMGCVVAVYDYTAREKAEGGVERSRTRRGTKKRGRRSSLKRRLKRAWAGVARREILDSPTRKMEKAMRSLSRINKLADRSIKFGLRLSLARGSAEQRYEYLDEALRDCYRKGGKPDTRLFLARKSAAGTLKNRRKRELDLFSAHWGIPRELTKRRISSIGKHPALRALPRIDLKHWSYLDGEQGAYARRLLSTALLELRRNESLYESEPCSCRACRLFVECGSGHAVYAGLRTCTCGWERHPRLPFRRNGNNRSRVARASPRGNSRSHPSESKR